MFAALRARNFRLYAACSFVSNIGTWMQRIAQDWLVLQVSGNSGVALGVTTALQYLPMVLLSPFFGAVADRYSKRRILLVTQSFLGLTGAVLGVMVLLDVVQVWHVFILAFAAGVGAACDTPTRQSFVSEMVPREDLPNAVALISASFNLARVFGPAVAGFMIVAFGTGPAFLVNAASFGATLIALLLMRTADLTPSVPTARGPGQIRDGLRYVRSRPRLVLVLVILFFVGTFGLNFQMTLALMATQVFDKGAGEFGVLGTMVAIGSVTGALMGARRGAPRLRVVPLAALGFGFAEIVGGVMPNFLLFAAILVLVGFMQMTVVNATNATIQLSVAPDMRGRVMAIYIVVLVGGVPLGAPILGLAAQLLGARWGMIGGGLICTVAALVATAVYMRTQGVRLRSKSRSGPPNPSEESTEDTAQDTARNTAQDTAVTSERVDPSDASAPPGA